MIESWDERYSPQTHGSFGKLVHGWNITRVLSKVETGFFMP